MKLQDYRAASRPSMLRIFVLLLSFLLPFAARAANEPADVVNTLHAALLDAMLHGDTLGCSGRLQRLEPVIASTFDLPFIAQHILKRRWESMTPAQREQFTATLKDLTVVTYATNFSHNSGVQFSTKESRALSKERYQVRAMLTPAHDDKVALDYFLQQSDGRWRVINVIADGVSDLALRSTQYDKVYTQSGFEGLMAKLREQIKSNRAPCNAG